MSFCSKEKNKRENFFAWQKGFSLIEMIVAIAIFMIIAGVVLMNMPATRDKSSADLVAQEVAINIRTAQQYAMSTIADSSGGIVKGYKITFDSSSQQSFKIIPVLSNGSEGIASEYGIKGGFKIVEPCIGYNFSGESPSCSSSGIDKLAIYFTRPNGKVTFLNDGAEVPSDSAGVKLVSSRDSSVFRYILVRKSGQIWTQK